MFPIKLQNLPKHITQRIAFKAAQWRKVGIDEALPNISNPAWKMVNYLALCQSWRSYCIPLYCQDMTISLDRTFGSIEDTHYWLSTINDVMRLSGQQYTRNAHLHVPLSQVLNGVLPRLLSEPPYRDAIFPNVSVIWFKLYAGGEIKDTVGDDRCNEFIDVLVSQIQRMFPSARICSISSSVALAGDEKWALKYCDVLFSKLMANSTGLKYYAASEHFVNTPVPLLAGLTRITYFECENASQFMQLICNNRETLVVVSLELTKPTTIVQMFAVDDQWLTFPRLERLDVDCQEHGLESRVHASGAPLFPSLKRLTFRHPYPFTNDAMFRGNYGKLEHLSLSLDSEDISSLLHAGVLKEGAFSALRFVDLDVNLSQQQSVGELAYGEQLCQMLWHLAPTQEHLSVNLLGFAYKEAFVQAVQHKELMGLLSFLSIGSMELDIWETIRILSHVPTLSQLEINPKTIDINKPWYLQNMTDARYVDDLVGWFHPLAPCLRHVLFDLGLYSDMEGAAHFAALLAILCPKVDCVRWGMHSAAFEKCCRALADSATYAKYAGRLRFVDWSKGSC
ncbi:hypothetical protein GGI23_004716 [Coemansia sp. RSA 2559]|nr:hypothetical protein GGI23_004716 [Coemansia sp. RSA 2559]